MPPADWPLSGRLSADWPLADRLPADGLTDERLLADPPAAAFGLKPTV